QDSELAKGGRQESQTALQDKTAQEKQAELGKKVEETRAALAQKAAREAEMEKSIQSMEKALKSESGEKSGSVRRGENSFTVEVADRILFNSGSARISPKGMKVIERIAGSVKEGSDKIIHVGGHTEAVAIAKEQPSRFMTLV